MAKLVRLNDKMWYGKYQGHTIKEIFSFDRAFLDNLMFKNRIIYHDNILKFLNEQKDQKSRWGEPTRITARYTTTDGNQGAHGERPVPIQELIEESNERSENQ